MLEISVGPFVTCLITSLVLTGYLYWVLHKSKSIFKCHVKIVFVILTIIMVRMLIPLNFPFTRTIYVRKSLRTLGNIIYMKILGNVEVVDVLCFIWLAGVVIAMSRYTVKRIKVRKYLKKYILTSEEEKTCDLSQYLALVKMKNIKIAIIPEEITPAIFGVIHPIIILPKDYYTYDDLEFIIRHEIQHYRNHDLYLKYIIDLLTIVHWWNPFVYRLRKEFNAALEFSNDYTVTKHFSEKSRLEYAESLLRVAKRNKKKFQYDLAMNDCSYLQERIYMLIDNNKLMKYKKTVTLFSHITFLVLVMMISLVVVPEITYFDEVNPQHEEEGIISINEDNGYFIRSEKGYDLYIDGTYCITVEKIDESLKGLPVYQEKP